MAGSFRQTLAFSAEVRGYGVHSGRPALVGISPAAPGAGIVFERADLPGAPRIAASLVAVAGSDRGTTLAAPGGAKVLTVEHLLSAFLGLGIDDALVRIEGEELPIGDGSAEIFTKALVTAGLRGSDRPRSPIRLSSPVWVEEGGSLLAAFPAPEGLRIEAVVTLDVPGFLAQFLALDLDPESYPREVAPARTFGYLREASALIERGLARGSGLANTVVITEGAVFSRSGLRFPDEFVRHKILDLVGDLALLGRPLAARVVAIRPGHRLNLALARKIMEVRGE